jgi:hypothetical protein
MASYLIEAGTSVVSSVILGFPRRPDLLGGRMTPNSKLSSQKLNQSSCSTTIKRSMFCPRQEDRLLRQLGPSVFPGKARGPRPGGLASQLSNRYCFVFIMLNNPTLARPANAKNLRFLHCGGGVSYLCWMGCTHLPGMLLRNRDRGVVSAGSSPLSEWHHEVIWMASVPSAFGTSYSR